MGARNPITVCTKENKMGVILSHDLSSMDLEDVTWPLLERNNRYVFPKNADTMHQTDVFKRCNAGLLDRTTDKAHLDGRESAVMGSSEDGELWLQELPLLKGFLPETQQKYVL